MADIDVDLSALGGKLTTCDVRIRGWALMARRGDKDAIRQIAEARSAKLSIGVELDLVAAARTALTEELAQALEREAQKAREAHAAEARAFADTIEPVGATLDRALGEFRDAYLDLKRRLHAAEQGGFGPSGALVQANLTQSLRALLWRITELEIQAPNAGLGKPFSSLTSGWSDAARGAAKRLLAPPASSSSSPGPNGMNGSSRPIPGPTDIGERFADDGPAFTIKDPKELAR
jgi:hypothetical protein